jgi:uncharacterized protein (DUF983 family)
MSFLRKLKRQKKKDDVPKMIGKNTGSFTVVCMNCGISNKGIIISGFGKFVRKCSGCGKPIHFTRSENDINMSNQFMKRLKHLPEKYQKYYIKKMKEKSYGEMKYEDKLKAMGMPVNNKGLRFMCLLEELGIANKFNEEGQTDELKGKVKSLAKKYLTSNCPACGGGDYIIHSDNFNICSCCGALEYSKPFELGDKNANEL